MVQDGCWDGPSDPTTAERLGISLEDVRHHRRQAFEKMRCGPGEALDGLELRVIWATYQIRLSDPDIAEGIGITLEQVKSARVRVFNKMLGDLDL